MVQRIEKFAEKLTEYRQEERDRIVEAAEWADLKHRGQTRASGEPYFLHPLQVAEILADLRMDPSTIISGLLHDLIEDTEVSREEIRQHFGKEVETLVNGVTKISILKVKNKNVQEAETIRKMLFAMVKDIRVILIKLADKLHNMRTLQFLPTEKRKSIARECLEIYAQLANRLGISSVQYELEDLSLRHLKPDTYNQIKAAVAQNREDRANLLERIQGAITEAAEAEGYQIEVQSRAKHFYSIYRKMKHKGKQLDEIYDILGLRIITRTENECYSVLGIIHRLFIPIEGRFKDYIAMPKANKYQSLHTSVMTYEGKVIEIQIRTDAMHKTAEYGIAAHWLYKQETAGKSFKPEDLSVINKIKSWDGVRINSRNLLDEIKQDLLKDSIYVFTPMGDVVELAAGSTPIDFAYHIHTEVGNHTMAAKADGVIVPLNKPLANTQVIEVITANNARPHVNWLRYVKTNRARSKIRSWLNKYDESVIIDKSIVAKKEPHPKHTEEPEESPKTGSPLLKQQIQKEVFDRDKVGIRIGEERNLMIRFAKCCNPRTGDPIIGYISRGRGIIIHRRDCKNLAGISDFQERKIEVEWETVSPKEVKRFKVTAKMSSDLFSEIEGAVKKFGGHLIEGRLEENDRGHLTGYFTMELERHDSSKQIMKRIRSIPKVMQIQPMPV